MIHFGDLTTNKTKKLHSWVWKDANKRKRRMRMIRMMSCKDSDLRGRRGRLFALCSWRNHERSAFCCSPWCCANGGPLVSLRYLTSGEAVKESPWGSPSISPLHIECMTRSLSQYWQLDAQLDHKTRVQPLQCKYSNMQAWFTVSHKKLQTQLLS